MTVESTDRAKQVGLLISYYITLSFWSAQTLALSMISRNVAGQTKKATVVAASFVAWAVGNAIGMYTHSPVPGPQQYRVQDDINSHTEYNIGPQVFLSWDAPRYFIAFATHMGCYVLLVIVIFGVRWHLKRQNSLKDRVIAERGGTAQEGNYVHAFDDLTDKENINFRYIF